MFGSLVFLEIAYNYSLQQFETSSRGKTHEKEFLDQIWAKTRQILAQNYIFYLFFNFGPLVFLDIACNDLVSKTKILEIKNKTLLG